MCKRNIARLPPVRILSGLNPATFRFTGQGFTQLIRLPRASCLSSLYILDINALPGIGFANTFYHSLGCLFILLMALFSVQKLFSLMQFRLFLFASVAFVGVSDPEKPLPRLMSLSLLPVFSSKELYGFRSDIQVFHLV